MGVEPIYWDSDAFLGWLQEEPGKVDLCEGTLQRAKLGEVLIFTSALTMAEILWRRGGPPLPKDKADMLNRFFRRSYFRVRNVTRRIAEAAQQIHWNDGVMPKDAIHVATALSDGIPVFETFDEDLLRKTGLIGSPPLVIRRPVAPAQRDMFPQ
jgi:predicted nucleic acid-binding protein